MGAPPKPVSLHVEAAKDLDANQVKLVEHLARVTNPFYRDTVGLLTNGLTVNANFKGGIVRVQVKVPADPEDAFPIFQTLPFTGSCGWVGFGGGRVLSGSGALQTAPVVTDWVQSGPDQIKINYITGLDSSTTYELRLLMLAD